MDQERKKDLKAAYHILNRFNLWHKGHTDIMPNPKSIGEAISVAAGAIIDFIAFEKEKNFINKSLAICEKELDYTQNQLGQQEFITLQTLKKLRETQTENNRLRCLLASHKIKYAKKK